MKREEVKVTVAQMLSEHFNVDTENLKDSSNLTEDLGADSLDSVEFIMALEEEFDIEIPDEEAETLTTVGAIVDYVLANK